MPIAPDADESTQSLHGPDEAIGFTEHIKPLFRASDREAAWLIMAEHLSDAADLVEAQGEDEPRLNPVAEALWRHAGVLRANSR